MEEDEKILQKKIVYDFFVDENPDVKERVEKARAEGFAQGMQEIAITVIEISFPTLLAQAQLLIEQMQDTDALEILFRQLISATAENEVRKLLHL